MSLLSKANLLARIRRSKEARTRLVASNLDKGIAFQIKATRDKREWSQAELATHAGMAQNNVSRLESPDYGKHTLSSLKRIAAALDVALIVRLVPFSQYVNWLSSTAYLDEGLRPEALAVPSFSDEEKGEKFQTRVRYFELHLPPMNVDNTKIVTPHAEQPNTPTAQIAAGSYMAFIVPNTSEKEAA